MTIFTLYSCYFRLYLFVLLLFFAYYKSLFSFIFTLICLLFFSLIVLPVINCQRSL